MIFIETKEKLNHWIIYMYTFPNGKRYIGKTKRSLSRRQGSFFNGYKNCTLLWNAIQKYGIENIKQEILFEDDMTDEYAARIEQSCILMFKTNANRFNNPSYGYNLTDGGDGMSGWKPDDEQYEKRIEQLHELHKKQIGSHLSEETKRKISEAHKGVKRPPMSEETKKKIAIANSKENMDEETKKRRSAAVKKKVVATHNETGEELVFESCERAAEYFGVRQSSITRWANGVRTPRNNYIFKIYPRTTTKRESLMQENA